MIDENLPFIDEHQLFVDAATDTVWDALTSWFAELSTSVLGAYLRVIAAQPAALREHHSTWTPRCPAFE